MRNIKSLGLLLATALPAAAQMPLHFGASLGYGFDFPTHNLGIDQTKTTDEIVTGTLGSGLVAEVAGGANLTEFFQARLALGYFAGSETDFSSDENGGSSKATVTGFLVTPSLRVVGGRTAKIRPTGELGLTMLFGGKGELVEREDGKKTTTTSDGGVGLGWTGSLGTLIAVNEKLSVTAGIFSRNVTWGATDWEIDGENSASGSYEDKKTTEPNDPKVKLIEYTDLSATGIKVGIEFQM